MRNQAEIMWKRAEKIKNLAEKKEKTGRKMWKRAEKNGNVQKKNRNQV